MAIDIDTLYEMLDERKPIEVQEEAIREARKIKSLSVFMQPIEYKLSWKNMRCWSGCGILTGREHF